MSSGFIKTSDGTEIFFKDWGAGILRCGRRDNFQPGRAVERSVPGEEGVRVITAGGLYRVKTSHDGSELWCDGVRPRRQDHRRGRSSGRASGF